MSGVQKAAILMLMLKDDSVVREIFSRLDQHEIYDISVAMTKLGNVDSDTVEKVLLEFAHDLNQSLEIVGTPKTAEQFLKRVLSEKDLENVLTKVKYANTSSTWEMMTNLDDRSIVQFIKNEKPQTTALILSRLPGYKSARIIKMLTKDYAVEVLIRMMYLDKVKIETMQSLEKVLEDQITDLSSPFNTDSNIKIVAEIFNSFDRDDEEYFMEALKAKDVLAAEKINDSMLSFDDLLLIRNNGINLVMEMIDNDTLITALVIASEDLQDLFLSRMSARVARLIRDEMESGIRFTRKESIEAQSKILKVVRNMLVDGSITIDKNFNG